MTTLEVDAITNSSDETLTESNSISERIIAVAGNQLKEELSTTVKGKQGERERRRKTLTRVAIPFCRVPHWGCACHAWIQSASQVCSAHCCTRLQGEAQDSCRECPALLLQVRA